MALEPRRAARTRRLRFYSCNDRSHHASPTWTRSSSPTPLAAHDRARSIVFVVARVEHGSHSIEDDLTILVLFAPA